MRLTDAVKEVPVIVRDLYESHVTRHIKVIAPTVLHVNVNLRCNTTCAMCSIWELKSPHALSLEQFDVLVHLAWAPSGTLPLHELTASMVVADALSRSGITRLLDRMERDGLITRTVSTTDRRRFDVSLTPPGRQRSATRERPGTAAFASGPTSAKA